MIWTFICLNHRIFKVMKLTPKIACENFMEQLLSDQLTPLNELSLKNL